MIPETPKNMCEMTLGTLTAGTNIPPNLPFWPLKWAEMGLKTTFGRKKNLPLKLPTMMPETPTSNLEVGLAR